MDGLRSRRAARELAHAGVREKPEARLAMGQRGHPSGLFILLPSKSWVMTSQGTRCASVPGEGSGLLGACPQSHLVYKHTLRQKKVGLWNHLPHFQRRNKDGDVAAATRT